MAQVKIFGLREQLDPIKRQLSDVIHSCVIVQKECGIAPQVWR